MANVNAPSGFTPVGLNGNSDVSFNTFARKGYSIASAYATDIFLGDPVKSTGTAAADSLGVRPGIELAVAGNTVRGVFMGCEYTNSDGERIFSQRWPASTVATDVIAHVADHPEIEFSIQADEDIVVGDIGAKADFVAGTGNTGTNLSGYMLDSSNITTGDGLIILGVDDRQLENNLGENYTRVIVRFREHELLGTPTAV